MLLTFLLALFHVLQFFLRARSLSIAFRVSNNRGLLVSAAISRQSSHVTRRIVAQMGVGKASWIAWMLQREDCRSATCPAVLFTIFPQSGHASRIAGF